MYPCGKTIAQLRDCDRAWPLFHYLLGLPPFQHLRGSVLKDVAFLIFQGILPLTLAALPFVLKQCLPWKHLIDTLSVGTMGVWPRWTDKQLGGNCCQGSVKTSGNYNPSPGGRQRKEFSPHNLFGIHKEIQKNAVSTIMVLLQLSSSALPSQQQLFHLQCTSSSGRRGVRNALQ